MTKDFNMLRQNLYKCLTLMLLILVAGCNKGSDKNTLQLLAGEDSKAWGTIEEITGSGSRQRLQREDRNEILRFYANGTFTVNTNIDHGNGTWFYDEGANTLTMQFQGAENTETFEVVNISEKELRLRAPDRSERAFQAEKP
jgi:hypothetical protein